MEINIERSPQHWCPSKGSNSELFAHENDTLTARPQLQLYMGYSLEKLQRRLGVIITCSYAVKSLKKVKVDNLIRAWKSDGGGRSESKEFLAKTWLLRT